MNVKPTDYHSVLLYIVCEGCQGHLSPSLKGESIVAKIPTVPYKPKPAMVKCPVCGKWVDASNQEGILGRPDAGEFGTVQ